jgi:hypothetical protein
MTGYETILRPLVTNVSPTSLQHPADMGHMKVKGLDTLSSNLSDGIPTPHA